MNTRMTLLAAAALFAFSAPAFAENTPASTSVVTEKAATVVKAAPAVKAAPKKHMKEDTDGDGFISKDEFMARTLERFKQMDTDNDGKISHDERVAASAKMKALKAAKTGDAAKQEDEPKKGLMGKFFQ